jgi:hypothetical protein
MLMEQHRRGAGTILFREMFSAESLTSPHPGFPELFQTGETYHGKGWSIVSTSDRAPASLHSFMSQ